MTEKQECSYCGKKATRETPVNGVYLCERHGCWIDYVENDGSDVIE
jgi:hypothetical protein